MANCILIYIKRLINIFARNGQKFITDQLAENSQAIGQLRTSLIRLIGVDSSHAKASNGDGR